VVAKAGGTQRRSPAAIRQARRRQRAGEDERVYACSLNERLVACVLQATGRDKDLELFTGEQEHHSECVRRLTPLIEEFFLSVTRDCDDDEIRAIVNELRRMRRVNSSFVA
jgi:hypothetical protein